MPKTAKQNLLPQQKSLRTNINTSNTSNTSKSNKKSNKPTWFENILISSDKHIGFYLNGLAKICENLLGLCRTLTITMLLATIIYAALVWRHVPAAEPRDLLVGWATCLLLADFGRLALEGKNAGPIRFSIVLIVVLYWLPIRYLSNLLQAF